MTNAQGIDVSSYQNDLLPATLASYDFAFAKVTEGLTFTDPHFAANWSALATWGKPRGAYHFLVPSVDATKQASFFVAMLATAGLKPTDILVCDSETAGASTEAATKAFLDRVRALCPHNPILVYASLDFLPGIATSDSYPLWLADYTSSAPASVTPWPTWMFWQHSDNGVDQDYFNGSAAELTAWIQSYQPETTTEDTDMNSGYIPAGDATHVISFTKGQFSEIAFFCDPTLSGKTANSLRVAMHSASKGFSQIDTMSASSAKVVIGPFGMTDVEAISIQRTDQAANWVPVAYNLT